MFTQPNIRRYLRLGMLAITGVGCLAAAVIAVPAFAQSRSQENVAVAIPDVFPLAAGQGPQENVIAIILRSPDHGDIILLNRQHAVPTALAAVIAGMRRSRIATPNPERGMMAVVRAGAQPQTGRNHGVLVRALQAVREQPSSRIGNVGDGRWLEFTPKDLGM